MAIDRQFLDELSDLGRRIAPEVPDFYLLTEEQLPKFPAIQGAPAFAVRGDVPTLQDAIREAGLWRGAYHAIVFNKVDIGHREALVTFQHEFSHVIDFSLVPIATKPASVEERIESE